MPLLLLVGVVKFSPKTTSETVPRPKASVHRASEGGVTVVGVMMG